MFDRDSREIAEQSYQETKDNYLEYYGIDLEAEAVEEEDLDETEAPF